MMRSIQMFLWRVNDKRMVVQSRIEHNIALWRILLKTDEPKYVYENVWYTPESLRLCFFDRLSGDYGSTYFVHDFELFPEDGDES